MQRAFTIAFFVAFLFATLSIYGASAEDTFGQPLRKTFSGTLFLPNTKTRPGTCGPNFETYASIAFESSDSFQFSSAEAGDSSSFRAVQCQKVAGDVNTRSGGATYKCKRESDSSGNVCIVMYMPSKSQDSSSWLWFSTHDPQLLFSIQLVPTSKTCPPTFGSYGCEKSNDSVTAISSLIAKGEMREKARFPMFIVYAIAGILLCCSAALGACFMVSIRKFLRRARNKMRLNRGVGDEQPLRFEDESSESFDGNIDDDELQDQSDDDNDLDPTDESQAVFAPK